MTVKYQIIFISSSTPKEIEAIRFYTKADFACFMLEDGIIIRYPISNIFQVSNKHYPHIGSEFASPSRK